MAACAASLGAFFVKHRALFEADEIEPVCESWFDADDLEVRFTVPYEAFEEFDVAPLGAPPGTEVASARVKVGRPRGG